jgi:hypothetical protein
MTELRKTPKMNLNEIGKEVQAGFFRLKEKNSVRHF